MNIEINRRTALRLGAFAAAALGLAPLAGCGARAQPSSAEFLRRPRFYIAHRGAGDEAPEHTMAAYSRAVDAGAEAVEISVRRTRDGVLVCYHDETLARTCAGAPGAVAELDFAALSQMRVDMSALVGPSWKPQPIPTLDEVLDRIGDRAVLFVEPKDGAAAADVLNAVTRRGLERNVVWKQHYRAKGDVAARQAGLAVWNYYDEGISLDEVRALAERSDAIGALVRSQPLSDAHRERAVAAVGTGRPVIAWTVNRRSEVEELAGLGVQGFMASSWTYLTQPAVGASEDGFATGMAQPGDQGADGRLQWSDGGIKLANGEPRQSVVMGSMSPIEPVRYRLSFEMQLTRLPPSDRDHFGVVVGRNDDSPFRFRDGMPSHGVLILLRSRGRLEIRTIPPDNGDSVLMAGATGPPVPPGLWDRITVDVADGLVRVIRATGDHKTMIEGRADTPGRYFAFTRNFAGTEGSALFRDVRVAAI